MKKLLSLLLMLLPFFAAGQDSTANDYYNRGMQLYNAQHANLAIPYFEKADSLDKRQQSKSSSIYYRSELALAKCWYDLAYYYNGINDPNETMRLQKMVVSTRYKIFGRYHSEYIAAKRLLDQYKAKYGLYTDADVYYNKGMELLNAHNVNEAIPFFEKSDSLEKASLDKVSEDYIHSEDCLMRCWLELASYFASQRNKAEAIKYQKLALEDCKIYFGKEHPDYEIVKYDLKVYHTLDHQETVGDEYYEEGMNLYKTQQSHLAVDYFAKSDSLEKALLTKKHFNYNRSEKQLVICRSDLANFYFSNGNPDMALENQTQATNIAKRVYGKKHPTYLNAQKTLDKMQMFINGKAGADDYYTRGMELKDDNPREALSYFQKADTLEKATLDPSSPNYNRSLLEIADCQQSIAYYWLGKNIYSSTIECQTNAVEIYKKIQGEEFDKYVDALELLCVYFSCFRIYSEYVRTKTTILELIKGRYGEESPQYIKQLCNFAFEYGFMENYIEAIRLRNIALKLAKTIYGEDSIDYASLLSDLACDYSRVDNDTAAIRLETKAMEIQKENYGETSSEYAQCLSNLAKYYCHAAYLGRGDYYPEAMKLQKSAVEIFKNNAEEDKAKDTYRFGSLYGGSLMSLAQIYYMIGNYSEAIKYQNLGIEFEKEYRMDDIPYRANAWKNLADYYLADGQYVKGNDLYNKIYVFCISDISDEFAGLSGDERARRWSQSYSYGPFFSEKIPYVAYKYLSANDTTLAGLAYNGLVLSKGFSLNSEFEILNVIEQKGNSVLKERYYKMNRDRTTLDSLMQISEDKRSIDADSLSKAINHEERALAGLARQLGDYIGNLAIDWTEIQKKLKDGDMAVEFANFRDDKEKKMYYAAFVLKNGMKFPVCVPLFEIDDFKDVRTTDYYKTPKLYNLVWKPLAKYLDGVKRVYFSPAGRLHTIAIESLPDENGKIFAEKFDACRLSSTRELVLQRTANPHKKAATYGGIKYDFTEEDWRGVKLVENDTIIGFHDTPQLANNQRGGGMVYLDGTLIESAEVANLLRTVDYDVDAFSDASATEESFKRLSGTGLKILHIGTHGFYQSEADMENAGFKFFTDAKQQQSKEDRSLSCSGLLFAGANSALDPRRYKEIPQGADDGILTAKEISRLDFRGLELVVLSACQTGLGEITGDGVFGLQRGFKKAGAQTIVMSLWKVSDESTQLLMIEFFKNLTAGQHKRAAFAAAQKVVRAKYPNPLHWAAFVMVDGI